MPRKLILLSVLVVIGIAGFFVYNSWHEESAAKTLTLYGNVDVRQVNLGFRVPGRVNEIYFEEGDFVKAGSLVGVLDKQPYLDELRQSKANAESIRASLTNAEILLKRRQELISDGSVSQEDLDNALANKLTLDANLAAAEATIAVTATNLEFTEVFAPTDGIILTRIREPGTVVNPGDPIYTLSIISPVWIRAFVSETYLGAIRPGMAAKIYTDTPNGKIYDGNIGFISPVAEFTPKTVETTQLRTDLVYRLRIYASNPDQGLRQGMPVTVKLEL